MNPNVENRGPEIEAFLNDQMNDQEKVAFTREIQQDPKLAEAVKMLELEARAGRVVNSRSG